MLFAERASTDPRLVLRRREVVIPVRIRASENALYPRRRGKTVFPLPYWMTGGRLCEGNVSRGEGGRRGSLLRCSRTTPMVRGSVMTATTRGVPLLRGETQKMPPLMAGQDEFGYLEPLSSLVRSQRAGPSAREDRRRGLGRYRAPGESCSSTACAAAMRAGVGKFLFASITMPIFLSGTKAT